MDRFNVAPKEQQASELTHRLEETTSRVPSSVLIGLAAASMVASAGIAIFSERKELANFIGLWAPSFLLMGIFNKVVRIEHRALAPELERRAA